MWSCQVTYKRAPITVSVTKPIFPKAIEPVQEASLDGFWVSKQTGQVVEVLENGSVILNRFSATSTQTIDKQDVQMDLVGSKLYLSYLDNVTKFQRPANIQASQLSGQWFVYTNESGYESSRILTYDELGYNYEIVELFHDDQSYSQYSQYYPYHFSEGFVFEDYFDETESYWYFLAQANEFEMTYVDEDGSSWVEEKYTDQPHVNIPDYYFDESF